jgi:hypothetical protein
MYDRNLGLRAGPQSGTSCKGASWEGVTGCRTDQREERGRRVTGAVPEVGHVARRMMALRWCWPARDAVDDLWRVAVARRIT